MTPPPVSQRPLRERVHDIIFQHDSPEERAFDGALTVTIVLSVLVVMLDSVGSIAARYGSMLRTAEWVFTVLFTIEYVLRLWTSPRPMRYARSFYGIVDLMAILPSYLSILFPPGRFLAALRLEWAYLRLAHAMKCDIGRINTQGQRLLD